MIFLPQEDEFAAFTTDSDFFPPVPLYQVGRGLCFTRLFLDASCSREANTAAADESLHTLLTAPSPAEGSTGFPHGRITVVIQCLQPLNLILY